MTKIKEIIIGTNNKGKYREIYDLLPHEVKKYSPKEFNILTPEETGESFEENSFIKASYFSKKTNLICLSDDSGLEIDLLKVENQAFILQDGRGKNSNFDLAIKKIYEKMGSIKKDWKNYNTARFICSLTLFWPNGKNYSSTGIIEGKISDKKKGKNGFGYDPIFIPNKASQTFGEMTNKQKISVDHRFKAFSKIKNFFI